MTTDKSSDADPRPMDVFNGSSATVVFWSKVGLAAALCETLVDSIYLVLAIVEKDEMALPGGVIRFLLVAVLTTLMGFRFTSAYWVLGGLLLLTCVMMFPFSLFSFGGERPVFSFSPLLLGLVVLHFTLGIIIVTAAIKRTISSPQS